MNAEEAIKFTDALVFSKLGMHLNDLQRLLVKSTWSDSRQCYEHIAKENGYSPSYLKQDVGPKLWQLLSTVFGEKVKKNTFKGVVERRAGLIYRFSSSGYGLAVTEITESTEVSTQQTGFANSPNLTVLPPSINEQSINSKSHDWNKAPDVSIFYGREQEQTILRQWVKVDNCRIIAILGMGGIGKTYLSVKLAEGMQSEFDFLIWRSLENEPPLKDILSDLLECIGQKEVADLCETTDAKISLLLDYLRKFRCLLILDNVETILNGGENIGDYKPGFKNYGDFFKGIGECRHQSCLIITSREKLKEVALMECEKPVRCMHLRGLSVQAGQQLLQLKGCHSDSENEYRFLVEQYSGNPLTLKIAAVGIKELFQGDIKEFIQHETLVIDEIFNLLEQQFNRLPNLAKSILRWLAIYRKPVHIAQLFSDMYPSVQKQALMENLKYLIQSSFVENKGNQFTLKQILMDFITKLLIDEIFQDILAGKLDLLNSYSLIKVKSTDTANKAHTNFFVKSVINKLFFDVFKNPHDLGIHLKSMYSKIDKSHDNKSGYAAENMFVLICHIPNNFVGNPLYTYKVSESKKKSSK